MSIVIILREPVALRLAYPLVMEREVAIPVSEPFHDFEAVDEGRLRCQDHSIGRILSVAEILHEFVFLRVLVNIGDHIPELAFTGNCDASKRMLKQAARTPVGLVDSLGVGVEEMRELLTDAVSPQGFSQPYRNMVGWIARVGNFLGLPNFLLRFGSYRKMEMVPQQAVGERIRDRLDVPSVQVHEVGVIALFDKNILAVDSAIVDVIVSVEEEWSGAAHVRGGDPKGLYEIGFRP